MFRYLIIAASSSIGQATCELLKNERHHIGMTARDRSKIKPDAILDATDFDAGDHVFPQAEDIEGVVNCTGSLFLRYPYKTSRDQYQAVIDAALITAFATVRAAGKNRAIIFLLDPKNNWITGQILAVDGGLSQVRVKMKIPQKVKI